MSANINVVEMFANPCEIYGAELAKMGDAYDDIVVLTADVMASNKLGQFRNAHPDRFFSVGIAEANLMGVGAGLALDGKVPFVSTFAALHRCARMSRSPSPGRRRMRSRNGSAKRG
jgi:transketolase C-terminal domain/subunit